MSARKFEAGSVLKTKLQVSPDLWKLLGTITAYLYIIFMLYLFEGIISYTTTSSSTGPLVLFP